MVKYLFIGTLLSCALLKHVCYIHFVLDTNNILNFVNIMLLKLGNFIAIIKLVIDLAVFYLYFTIFPQIYNATLKIKYIYLKKYIYILNIQQQKLFIIIQNIWWVYNK